MVSWVARPSNCDSPERLSAMTFGLLIAAFWAHESAEVQPRSPDTA